MKKDMSAVTTITIDKTMIGSLMETLGVINCQACGNKITTHSYGGSLVLGRADGIVHFHNSLLCLMTYIKAARQE